MWATRAISLLINILFIPVSIVSFFTLLAFSLFGIVTLGIGTLIVGLISVAIWMLAMASLLALAWLWHRLHWLSHPLFAALAIPLAIAANTYLAFVPDERLPKQSKQLLGQLWPYSIAADDDEETLVQALQREMGIVSLEP